MAEFGVIEGFYGPAWSDAARRDLFDFMADYGFGFYFYAPKEDSRLRKKWRETWDAAYLAELRALSDACRAAGVKFGIGLSPYGFGQEQDQAADQKILDARIAQINEIGVDILGLFFDDMYGDDKIADRQISAVNKAADQFDGRIVFCPSYYSDDEVLDRIFGARPAGYLEALGAGLPKDIEVVWTGPKVISSEISAEHLARIAATLKRQPFIWDNLYANDGPKNCKFLKLKPFSGRDVAGMWGINPMNQIALDKIVLLAVQKTAVDGLSPEEALQLAAKELLSKPLASLLLQHAPLFLEQGLDNISDAQKQTLIAQFRAYNKEPAATEIADWLEGKYIVGPECLTD